MSLTENDAIRMAQALDDFDRLTVTDIRGRGADCSIVVRDHRFDTLHEISSHCDHLDFLASFASHRPYLFTLEDIESPSGVAHCNGSAAHASAAAPEESHTVTVWDLPGELAENAGKHELECNTCGVIGAIENDELASKLAELHADFFGPLRDLANAN